MSYEKFDNKLPDDKEFYKTLLGWIKVKQEDDLFELIQGGKCFINSTDSYSRMRWNTIGATVYFYIPLENMSKANEDAKSRLRKICNEVLPKENGYDVIAIDFLPLITMSEEQDSLINDLERNLDSMRSKIIGVIFTPDIKEKGQEMTEAYMYLYYVENALRLFIDKIGMDSLGKDYFNSIKTNTEIRNKVLGRKQNEERNRWKSVRGDSDVFYLDFADIGSIIVNNWDIFSKYFPDQNWISSKIKELTECRNHIAHNSYIGSHERDIIRINFTSILRQIDDVSSATT